MCITNSLELKAVLEAWYTMRATDATDGDDQFVVWYIDALHVAMSVGRLDFKQPFAHHDVNSATCQELAMYACNDLPQRLYETADRYSPDSGR